MKTKLQSDMDLLPNSSFTLEELKEIPVSERERMIPPTYKAKYFKSKTSIMSFWMPIILIASNVILAGINNEGNQGVWVLGLFFVTFPSGLVLLANLAIHAGYVSSNHGTYIREKEPVAFWLNIVILYIVTLLFNGPFFFALIPLLK